MKSPKIALLLALTLLAPCARVARAQDNVQGSAEPIDPSIEPSKLTYDYLVDGNLTQDDPAAKKFKTLQAAYAAAPAGTEAKPTVIGIMPNVYQLPGSAPRTPSMSITKNWITFLGLTNNRRAVVLADNRGLMEGAEDDGYILDVNDTGFSMRNLTVVNYCNNNYEYPGDPGKNLTMRSPVVTQGVALQASGDKHVYVNVALLGRLDTMFLRTARSYFKNVYIEGTDDWMGGGQLSVWEDCTLVYITGRGVMSASGVDFFRCRFVAERGMAWYKAEFRGAERPDVLVDCIVPVNSPKSPVSWIRGISPPRPNVYTVTYHNKDANGNPAVIADCTVGAPTFTYSRELSEQEVKAYNPWNLLRQSPTAAPDDWDPAGVREKYAADGDLVYRVALNNGRAPAGGAGGGASGFGGFGSTAPAAGNIHLRTGGPDGTIGASVTPRRASDQPITWSTDSDLISLSATTGPRIVVTGRNGTAQAEWVSIKASAQDGCYVTAWVNVEPKFIDPPAVTTAPAINPPAGGSATVAYALALAGHEDQSLITWYLCDDASGANPRKIAVSRGDEPLRSLPLLPGYAGKYLKVAIQPKHSLSEAGPAVTAVSAAPVQASDVLTTTISPRFQNFAPEANASYVSGLWNILGTWDIVTGNSYAGGYGLHPGTTPGAGRGGSDNHYLLFQNDADVGDMQLDLLMAPEKTEGTGFSIPGSPADTGLRNLHAEIYIKYDPRTKTGYSLRFWRTIESAGTCMYQFYKIDHGVGTPLDDRQVLSGVFKPTTHLVLKATATTLSVHASNDVDQSTLDLEGTIPASRAGGAGLYWPRGSSNIYSRIALSYPGAGATK